MPDNTANNVKRNVPLVRTEGKKYQSGAMWSVDLMLSDPRLLRDQRDRIAREAEVVFGLQPSLYFYVGLACPAFATEANAWIFVFAADTFDGQPGTMTPFDTGGFLTEKIHLDREVDRAGLRRRHRADDLAGWRDKFRAYVEEHFSSARAYVLGERATKADPDGRLLHPENKDSRAWTWELQLDGDHDVRVGLLRLWLLYDHKRLLNQRIRQRPRPERLRWREALG